MITAPRIAVTIIALGGLGIVFTAMGWQRQVASPAFFLGGSLIVFMWGIVMFCYYRIALRRVDSPLFKPKNAAGFQAATFIINAILLIAGIATVSQQSRWLYGSFAALVLAEFLMVGWLHAIRKGPADAKREGM